MSLALVKAHCAKLLGKQVYDVADRVIEKKVNKAITDNLHGWDAKQLDGPRDDDGFTGRQRIWVIKLLHHIDCQRFPIGKNFFKDFKITFQADSSPQKLLKPADNSEEVGKTLMDAMIQYKETGNRSKMLNAIMLLECANSIEACGICQFALEVKASSSSEQLRISKLLVAVFVELEFRKKHPGVFCHMKSWLDDLFCHLHSSQKGCVKSPRDFYECHPAAVLLLPIDETNEIKDIEEDYSKHEPSVITVMGSCDLGARLYGGVVEQLLGQKVNKICNTDVKALMTRNVITAANLLAAKRATVKKIQAMDGMTYLPEKRTIQLIYRGTPYKQHLKGLWSQVETVYDNEWRAVATAVGDLTPTLCENDLVADPTTNFKKGKIAKEVYKATDLMRKHINRQVSATTKGDGASVADFFKAEETKLLGQDAGALMECEFFKGMVGDGGELALEQNVMKQLPSNEQHKSLDDVQRAMRVIQTSALYKFTGAGPQGTVLNVMAFLTDIESGRMPTFPKNAGAFLVEVKLRLGFLCACIDDKKVNLRAAPAAALAAQRALAKPAPTLKDLEIPITYSWLLDNATRAKVEEARLKAQETGGQTIGQVAKQVAIKRSAAASSGGASSSAVPAAKKSKTSVDAAMAMFKGLSRRA